MIPSQVDDLDGDGKGDELVWVKTLFPGENKVLVLLHAGRSGPAGYTPRADAAMNWDKGTKANIGWESDQAAYRFYYGQIEAFGKRANGNKPARLILAGLGS